MTVLGIESSCDETGVGILRGKNLLANVVATQESIHQLYGGIVPELASRAHCSRIDRLYWLALKRSRCVPSSLNAIGVTTEPGLKGSLLVGVSFATGLGYGLDIPVYQVNHLQAHLAANYLQPNLSFPALGLVVSGGHTTLFYLKDKISFQIIGSTLDDACGETFDKVARMMNLPFPGGPEIERLAKQGNPEKFRFPVPLLSPKSLNFSFSGLKTAVLYHLNRYGRKDVPDICASFQKTVTEVLREKVRRALEIYQVKTFLFGGGVMRNKTISKQLKEFLRSVGVMAIIPEGKLCLDNGGMVAIMTAALIESGVSPPERVIRVVPTK
ncbi:MAG: tRNA (adenosine(37)-N6)-threonylcarbamoyltransferase complex transferase subunit TsaD [Candidatus Omnitrophica bacterium]|nr:tRNA (adenosine(37)-N6)-threonylcarbamoyltransferase complex transferase subunit TsaD [Candidatus Omnitrophota bacterium]